MSTNGAVTINVFDTIDAVFTGDLHYNYATSKSVGDLHYLCY